MNATVLLAEDEAVSRVFLVDALAALGLACDAVADGEVALQQARANRYTALVLDLNLPSRDGIGILAALRGDANAASHAVPALALTADDSPATRARLLAAGFAGVACKPLAIDALANALRGVGVEIVDRTVASGSAPASAAPIWDDAAALAAAGGNGTIVETLRGMMLQELPRQRDVVIAALARGDATAARAELHRMIASCGFCGAVALAGSVRALNAALADSDTLNPSFAREREAFLHDVEVTRATQADA